MNATRTTLAAVMALSALSAASLAQASPTEFPLPTGSTLSRGEVVAETVRAMHNGELDRHNASYTPGHEMRDAQMSMGSQKTRNEVRHEAAMARASTDPIAASYFVGGM